MHLLMLCFKVFVQAIRFATRLIHWWFSIITETWRSLPRSSIPNRMHSFSSSSWGNVYRRRRVSHLVLVGAYFWQLILVVLRPRLLEWSSKSCWLSLPLLKIFFDCPVASCYEVVYVTVRRLVGYDATSQNGAGLLAGSTYTIYCLSMFDQFWAWGIATEEATAKEVIASQWMFYFFTSSTTKKNNTLRIAAQKGSIYYH